MQRVRIGDRETPDRQPVFLQIQFGALQIDGRAVR
jgi:hypothetical protein